MTGSEANDPSVLSLEVRIRLRQGRLVEFSLVVVREVPLLFYALRFEFSVSFSPSSLNPVSRNLSRYTEAAGWPVSNFLLHSLFFFFFFTVAVVVLEGKLLPCRSVPPPILSRYGVSRCLFYPPLSSSKELSPLRVTSTQLHAPVHRFFLSYPSERLFRPSWSSLLQLFTAGLSPRLHLC